jgi:hypothetical protein
MRRILALGMFLAITATGLTQESKVREHPFGTEGAYSAFRYTADPAVCPPGGGDSVIPLSETRRILCEVAESPLMSKKVEEWVDLALAQVEDLNKEDVAVTYLEVCRENNGPPHFGHLHGNEMMYASSVAKMFQVTALYWTLQENGLPVTKALNDDVIAALHDNNHAAANRLFDYMTNTKSGPPLGYPEFCKFAAKRDYVNWFFTNVGFVNFNLNQKMYPLPPSPRDLQLLGDKLILNYENSNRVTTNQAAALMYLIDQEAIVSHCASLALKSYMYRPLEQEKLRPLQGVAWGLPVGAKIVNMEGYTDANYHDISLVTLPNHKQYVLAVMTKYRNYPSMFIPLLSRIVAHRQMVKTGDDNELDDYLQGRPRSGQVDWP